MDERRAHGQRRPARRRPARRTSASQRSRRSPCPSRYVCSIVASTSRAATSVSPLAIACSMASSLASVARRTRRGPPVEIGRGPGLAPLELRREVVAQQMVVPVGVPGRRRPADQQVRAARRRSRSGGVGQAWRRPRQAGLDHVEDRRPGEQPPRPVVEDGSQLGAQVLGDVAVAPRDVDRPGGRRRHSRCPGSPGRSPPPSPPFGPPAPGPARRVILCPTRAGERLASSALERQLLAADLEHASLDTQTSEGQVGHRARGQDHLESARRMLQQRAERIEARAVGEAVDVVKDQDARARPTGAARMRGGERPRQDADPRRRERLA